MAGVVCEAVVEGDGGGEGLKGLSPEKDQLPSALHRITGAEKANPG